MHLSIPLPSRTGHRARRGISAVLPLISNATSTLISWPRRAYESRRLSWTLAQMSEHDLSDIGLSRQDVVDTSAMPLGSNVGEFLAERATSRRADRRR
ncbi:DUF1127 domain-containing protein [Lichenihabitans sp. PAMC28606]|uniref:DUF1127 domain-containing protein n=1 Tax=Lichenihabitans sp. PAMC28606 TaxID=2880932 RepID=UPI001D0B6ED7|nr:DUF1127 domain-containing protein [Lichenihabitans sp. PAMC28606]UDL95135.1 DUF1127 domain-containing protein [Lichenihabitans sp. PAMC28606]